MSAGQAPGPLHEYTRLTLESWHLCETIGPLHNLGCEHIGQVSKAVVQIAPNLTKFPALRADVTQ